MTRKEQIERSASIYKIDQDIENHYENFINDAIQKAYIEGAKWADNHPNKIRWISVEEGLPLFGQLVLVRYSTGLEYDITWRTKIKKFNMDKNQFRVTIKGSEVAHWLEIPEIDE